jgi:signal transduction histidine kinase
MLVEDDRDMGEAMEATLQGAGYQVDRCHDGSQALEHLSAGPIPDVIILDLRMPRLDGWQFRVQQRNREEWAAIPVIVLSADSSAPALAIDADRHLQKPIQASALLDTVERLLLARERVRLEARAAELDRLSSLGVLAAGLAHEVNNPLTFVLGNLELALRRCRNSAAPQSAAAVGETPSLEHLLDHALQGAERIASVMRSMSTFARPDIEQRVSMNVQDIMESSLLLVANEIRHHARLERDYALVPPVLGSPAQLGQVFINLLINAVHAIGKGDPMDDTIRVATRVAEDGKVVITVADSGSGIAPEVVGRVFDPFFSTKDVGIGMGLGLSISQRLITDMGGTIRVESSLGDGSTFSVTLPAHQAAVLEPAAPRAKPAPFEKRASILVVDDEPMMCELLSGMLSKQFDVTTFHKPRAALERLLFGPPFDLILCDLMMPELTGMALHAELVRVHSEQAERFIFMTGGAFTELAREFVLGVQAPLLMKPFHADTLNDAVTARLQDLPTVPSYH